MILYFAGKGSDRVALSEKADVLKSFACKSDTRSFLKKEWDTRFFLDSGAFSAFSLGEQIDINEYAAFIKANKSRITLASNLDVIGSWEGTKQNQIALEGMGCDVLPVFHRGEPWEILEEYVKQYQYIALGGLVPVARFRGKMETFLNKAFSIIKTRSFVHGFGVNAVWAWKRYPFYSVDATSWLMGPRMRTVYTWRNGQMESVRKSEGEMNGTRIKAATAHYHDLATLNLKAYREAQGFVTDLWKHRGIEYPEHFGRIKR